MSTEVKWRYDVFLCYRGEDTRYTFTGNLYNALRQNRIKTFMDQGGLKTGDDISSTLLKALDDSRISVVVLSENFASSTWCLQELVKILECRKKKDQLVLPIFYDVDPSHVREQTRAFGRDMVRNEERFGLDRPREWRSALYDVGCLAGLCFDRYNFEYELIEHVVEWIRNRLPRYDVYLSFSEKDTRYSFTGFLYDTLHREGFKTIMKGSGFDQKEDQLTAVEKSRLSIVVLSENYAYSSSCLDELVMILDCMKKQNQLIWPVFYKVDPSDVRHQRNSYEKAMTGHENDFGKDSEKVQKWRSALFEVANLKGWHLKYRYEYEAIEKIVEAAIKFC